MPKMTCFFAVASLVGVLAVSTVAAQVVPKKPMPTPRMGAAAAVVEGRIYVIGGFSKQGKPVATVEEYDPQKDTWTTRTPMPTARGMLAAAAVGGTVYTLGGRSREALSVVEAYDVRTDRWTPAAPLPQGRWGLMATEAGGKLFAIGGITGIGAMRQSVSSVDIFDLKKKAWTAGKPLPIALQGAAVANHDGQIFVAGGRVGAGDTGSATNVVYVYRTEVSTWTKAPSLIEARTAVSAAVVGSKLVVAGGAVDGNPSPSVEVLDVTSREWGRSGVALSAPRTGHVTASANGKIYVIGGATVESLAGITGLVEEITVH